MEATLSFPEITLSYEVPPEPASVVPVVAPVTALALPVVTLKSAALAHFAGLEAPLRELAERYRAVAFDLTTNKGMEAAKKARNDLRENGRYAVQRAEETFKDGVNDAKKAVAPKVAELIAIVRPIEDSVHTQIEARLAVVAAEKAEAERKEIARKSEHEADLSNIRGYVAEATGKMAEQILNAARIVAAIGFGPEWEEYAERAVAARDETVATLQALAAKAQTAEEAAAELLRKKAENERIAAELAAERARLAAEAEAAKKVREAEMAELQAERQRMEIARAALAAEAEAQRKAAEPPPVAPEPVAAVVAPPPALQELVAPVPAISRPLTLPLEPELSELASELPDESLVHLCAGDAQGTTNDSTVAPVDQAAADMDAVALMLDRAINNGLAVEIVMAFGVMRRGGDDTQTSAAAALNEWDI